MIRSSILCKLQLITALTFICLNGHCFGDILWDQQPDPDGPNITDQSYSDFPSFSTFVANDVVFNQDVLVTGVTAYFTNDNESWPQGTNGTAILNVFTGEPLSDSDDPAAGQQVAVDYTTNSSGYLEVSASGLNLGLSPGAYWFGLTPELDFDTYGQEFHLSTSPIGLPSFARNPGNGIGLGDGWQEASVYGSIGFVDGSIRVEGIPQTIPEPTATFALFGVVSFIAGHRRRLPLI